MTGSVYCTYFDSAYASRGLVLVRSLRQVGDQARVIVLALDDVAHSVASSWAHLNVTAIRLRDLEEAYPALLTAKASRSRMEYVFTLTPWLTQWAMQQTDPGSWTTYLDADMGFYSGTDPIYSAVESASVAIVEHRFTREQAWRLKYGRFNVAWVGFRNDVRGRACLAWWAERCLEWCGDEVSKGRFADQRYLDRFPEMFRGVAIIHHPGVDLAPWNLRRHRLSRGASDEVLVDGEPLIFFHFHGLKSSGRRYYFKHLPYLARTTPIVRDMIYRPYCRDLSAASLSLSGEAPTPLDRRPTFSKSLRLGVGRLIRWLGDRRGDYVDV